MLILYNTNPLFCSFPVARVVLEKIHFQSGFLGKIDIGKLPDSLKKLDFVWDEKKIVFSQGNQYVENLTIQNFNDKDCSRLLNFKNVKKLFIETEKKCKSLSHIEELKQLEYLTVIAKHESIQGIQKLDNLINLGLCDFKIQNLNELKQLKNLKTLFISIKSLNDISALSGLENLEAITFDGCWSMEDFSPLKKLKKLRFLEITDSKKLQSIEFVKQLTNLEQLTLYGTTIIIDNNLQPANHIPRVYVQKYLKTYNLNITDKAPKGERKRIHNFM